ncbi:MAG: sulfite exporter TauE/SafE family protein [Bdellovibrionales bacterium]|nr:sulfite exporter TauE/SafE family protein [Bdellovibrionales bacterium]
MSVPYVDSATWVPAAVLAASLLGSPHCVSMCGGLVVASVRGPASWMGYHFGRLVGYLALGALAGFLGSQILSESVDSKFLSIFAASTMAAAFFVAGFRVWRGKSLHLMVLPGAVYSKLNQKWSGSSAGMGVLTAFLPCGWLHAFVLGAVATQRPSLGAGFLFLFWLGTLPALSAAPWLLQRIFRPVILRSPRIAAMVLMVAGLVSVSVKVYPLLQTAPNLSCH